MPGKRDRNIRSGNIHEELGLLLLRPVALVAPVPLWEDVGLDAVATLLRPEGRRRLIPEDAFGVQLKASSVRVVSYDDKPARSSRRRRKRKPEGDAARWVVNLGLPFFIGSARIKDAAIDLFPTHALFQVRPHPGLKEVHLHLDPHANHFGSPEVAHVYIGPPALTWSTSDLADRDFPARAYPVLKGHICAAQRNIQGRSVGYFEPVVWETGRPPEQTGQYMIQGGAGRNLSDLLAPLVGPVRAVLSELGRPDRLTLLPVLFEFIKLVRSLGTELDPGDYLMIGAVGGPPTEDRKEVIRRLLWQGMSPARFWWHGQEVDPFAPPPEPPQRAVGAAEGPVGEGGAPLA